MKIIPAIDIIDDQAVRLFQGDFKQMKVYSDDPIETAKAFESIGLRNLHMVDLEGAKAGKVINWKTLEGICEQTELNIDFGGGIKTALDLEMVLKAGAAQVTIGTLAVKDQDQVKKWIQNYGPDKIILGADVRNRNVAISGWQEDSLIGIFDFLSIFYKEGIEYVICTDISKDGTLEGSAEQLYRDILNEFPNIKLIASGGVTSTAELDRLNSIGCHGAIIGKALYEGVLLPGELAEWEEKN